MYCNMHYMNYSEGIKYSVSHTKYYDMMNVVEYKLSDDYQIDTFTMHTYTENW